MHQESGKASNFWREVAKGGMRRKDTQPPMITHPRMERAEKACKVFGFVGLLAG